MRVKITRLRIDCHFSPNGGYSYLTSQFDFSQNIIIIICALYDGHTVKWTRRWFYSVVFMCVRAMIVLLWLVHCFIFIYTLFPSNGIALRFVECLLLLNAFKCNVLEFHSLANSRHGVNRPSTEWNNTKQIAAEVQ